MPRRVSIVTALMCTGIAIAMTVGACLGLERWEELQRATLLSMHDKDMTARKEQFEVRKLSHQIEARDASVARRARHRREFAAALGGPVDVALKHPELTMLGMLHELARACAPPGSVSHVAVERFTEFAVLIDLPRRETNAVLAEVARRM